MILNLESLNQNPLSTIILLVFFQKSSVSTPLDTTYQKGTFFDIFYSPKKPLLWLFSRSCFT